MTSAREPNDEAAAYLAGYDAYMADEIDIDRENDDEAYAAGADAAWLDDIDGGTPGPRRHPDRHRNYKGAALRRRAAP